MIYSDEFIPWLKEKLGRAELNSARSEILTYCPYCESKRDRRKHGHLYISTSSPEFYCQKCEEGGIIYRLIRVLNSDPSKYVKEGITVSNKTQKKYKVLSKRDFKLPEIEGNDSKKIDYLRGRINKDFDINKIPGLIFSFQSFIELNNIKNLKESPGLIKYLNDQFIGFLCTRGSKIFFRNINSNSDFKFYQLGLFEDIYKDFYGLKFNNPTQEVPKILLAEGVFDILNPATSPNFKELRKQCIMWAASIGMSSLTDVLKSVIDYCQIVKVDLVFFSDQDVNEKFYERFKKNPFVNNVVVYWNKVSKDFGDKNIIPYRKEIKLRRIR